MQITSFIVAALGLAMSVSASPAAKAKTMKARQTSQTIVGQGFLSGQEQDLSFVIVDTDNNSGSAGFAGAGIDSAVLLSGDLAGTGFTSASCTFTTDRIGNDGDDNIACDLTTQITTLSSGDPETSFNGLIANCMFCSVE